MTYAQSLRTRARLSHAIKYLRNDPSARAILCIALTQVNKLHRSYFQDTNWNRNHWCGKCWRYNLQGEARPSLTPAASSQQPGASS